MEYEAFSMKMDPALMESLLVNLIDNAAKGYGYRWEYSGKSI